MKKILFVLLALMLCHGLAHAALTKAVELEDDWTAVAANTVVEGATVDVSAHYQSVVTIACTLVTGGTASANGPEIRVQISANTTRDEDWIDLTSFQGPTGTPNVEPLTNNPAGAGTTTFTCASTTGYTLPTGTDNGLRYIKDSTIANSEIFLQTAVSSNTSVTALDGSTNSHVQNTNMYNIVGVYTVSLPDSANRVRIVYNNCKDAAGSACDVSARISSITGI